MKFLDLPGSRIDLVELDELALLDIHEYSQLPEFYQFMEYGAYGSLDETRSLLKKLKDRTKNSEGFFWAVRLKSENKVIGTFGVVGIDARKGMAEISYGLSPLHWGKGYFSEALGMVLHFLFTEKSFHRIWAITQNDNKPSIQALVKMGFIREGILRDYYLSDTTGRRRDAVMLGLLAGDFRQRNESKTP